MKANEIKTNKIKVNRIKVSILMPSLNVAKYIRQCIKSVTDQTLKEIEIICIDAGSTDGTREVIDEFAKKDERITVIDSPIKSYGHQMNLGIDAAHGEYIGIIETDDFVDSNAFEDLYRIATENDADIVRANYYEYRDETGDILLDNTKLKHSAKRFSTSLRSNKPFDITEHPELLLQSKGIWSGIYKRGFLNEHNIRFLESKGAAYQDVGFFLKSCLCAKCVILTDKAYLHYRMDNENSSVNSGDKIFAVCDEYEELEEFIKRKRDSIFISKDIKKALVAAKIGDYLWNFQRVPDTDKEIFAEGMQKDFSLIPYDEILENEFLSDRFKKDTQRIISDPKAYVRYRKTLVSRFVHCTDDKGLKYTLKYMMNKATGK